MKRILPILMLASLILTGCEDKYPSGSELREGVTRATEYLYESTCYDYSPAPALRLMERDDLLPGACTAVRNGQFVGRNFDWLYDQSVEFVIRVPHTEEHYASVGIAGGIPTFTAQVVESGAESEFYDALPYVTLDGINEHGVFCCINMLPTGDAPMTDNTHPGADSLGMLMVPRYVLDHAATADEAVSLLSEANIIRCKAIDLEAHFMIADSTSTYIVEWIDGRLHAEKDSFCILTNFYLLQPMTPHSMGIERYDLARRNYATAGDLPGMTKLMHSLRQSRMYDKHTSPFWYSEYNGDWTEYGLGDLTIESVPDDYAKVIKGDLRRYRRNKRDYRLDIWHTKHTAIYDFSARKVLFYVQEKYDRYFEYSVE